MGAMLVLSSESAPKSKPGIFGGSDACEKRMKDQVFLGGRKLSSDGFCSVSTRRLLSKLEYPVLAESILCSLNPGVGGEEFVDECW